MRPPDAPKRSITGITEAERDRSHGLAMSELMRDASRLLRQGHWFEAQVWSGGAKFLYRTGSDIDYFFVLRVAYGR